jgi:hypothetical protein
MRQRLYCYFVSMVKLLMFFMVSILLYATFLLFHLNGFLLTKKEVSTVAE